MIHRCLITVLWVMSTLMVSAQKPEIHSHNDYNQARPFWGAYEAKAASIEADIWLIDGVIYVAHDREKVKADCLLKNMYLNPIRQVMDKNGGTAYPEGKGFQLLVDLKSGPETLDNLISLIRTEEMEAYFDAKNNPNAVQIVITGDKIAKEHFTQYPDYIYFDGLPNVDYTEEQLEHIPMISAYRGHFTKWRGKGKMDKADRKRIKEAVKSAHKKGCKFRIWAFPDNEEGWEMSKKLGVDFINTDHPDRVANMK